MEFVWSLYGIPMEHHRSNPGATPEQRANNAPTLTGALGRAASRNSLPGCGGSPIMPGAMPPPEQPTSPNAAPPASLRPSHARYWVIVFAVALAIIQYVDKVCISQAAPFIQKDLGLREDQMGWVFAAFTLAYALFEIPAGYLGDRFGPRRVLLRIVIWWSFCTAALGRMWSCGSLGGDAVPVRGGRGWGLPEPDQGVQPLAAAAGTHAGARHHVDERAAGRRAHANVGVSVPATRHLADGVPALRPAGSDLGRPVLLVVS